MSLYQLNAGNCVLLVGEGDFSFSVAFVQQLATGIKMIASCLHSEVQLHHLHRAAAEHIQFLLEKGVDVLYEVDATSLKHCSQLHNILFNRIIFNFPHVGGKSNIKKNRQLLKDFFASAVKKLADAGDICVSFCQGQGGTPADEPVRAWHDSWQSVCASTYQNLVLREIWPFSISDYPQYSSRGFRSLDKNFYTGGALTYVFRKCIPFPELCDFNRLDISLPNTIIVNGTEHSVDSTYVAWHGCRHLHKTKGHPVQLMVKHIHKVLTKEAPLTVVDIQELSPVVQINEDVTWMYKITPTRMTRTDNIIVEESVKKDVICADGNAELPSDQSVDILSEQGLNSATSHLDKHGTHYEPGSVSTSIRQNNEKEPPVENVNENLVMEKDSISNQHLCQSAFNHSECSNICSDVSKHEAVSGGNLYLHSTLLDSMPSNSMPDILHCYYGCVYNRGVSIDCHDLPIKHEMVITLSDYNQNLSLMKDLAQRVISAAIGEEHNVLLTVDHDDIELRLINHIQRSDLHIVEVVCKSINQRTTTACNQVNNTGKPSIPEKSVKCSKISRHCGYLGVKHDQTIILLLDLDMLCQIKYDIPDARLLSSQDPAFLTQFCDLAPDCSCRFKPLSLYPPLWRHDVSFWDNPEREFSENHLMDVVRDLAGNSLKCVMLRNVWTEPETGRISRCYRLVYQSYEHAISHTLGHQIQSVIRLALANCLGVVLR